MGVGLLACMTQAAQQVLRGQMSVGDLVLVNTYLLQLYQPLNWIGRCARGGVYVVAAVLLRRGGGGVVYR